MACEKSNAHPCGEHLACPKSLLLRVFRVFRGSNGSFQVEPSELPRGFGVRWLPVLRSGTAEGGAGNGADTALDGLRWTKAKAVCPHPSPTALQDAGAPSQRASRQKGKPQAGSQTSCRSSLGLRFSSGRLLRALKAISAGKNPRQRVD